MTVVIIGAGPAGAACAIQLLKAGFKVTLLDVAHFPRFRPGESCHPGIEPLLKQLGVWQEVVDLNPARYNSVFVNTNGFEREDFFNDGKDWQGFQLPRDAFDTVLVKKCIALGAMVSPGTRVLSFKTNGDNVVSVVCEAGEFNCDYLVDATGSKALTSVKLDLPKKLYSNRVISYYRQVGVEDELAPKFKSYFEITANYWGYISLIKPKTYSVAFSTYHNDKNRESIFFDNHFTGAYKTILSKGFETSWAITTNNVFENLYHVGDAFITFDPTSAKGILKAIMTGIYAAHIIANINNAALTKTQGLAMYQAWGMDFIEKELTAIKQLIPTSMSENVFID